VGSHVLAENAVTASWPPTAMIMIVMVIYSPTKVHFQNYESSVAIIDGSSGTGKLTLIKEFQHEVREKSHLAEFVLKASVTPW